MLTVMSWHVDGWHTIRDAQIELLDATGAELARLQAVTQKSADVLRAAGWEIVTALELLPPEHAERAGRRPRFSCAVATRGPLTIAGVEVLAEAPSPFRTLVARITRRDGDGEFTAIRASVLYSAAISPHGVPARSPIRRIGCGIVPFAADVCDR